MLRSIFLKKNFEMFLKEGAPFELVISTPASRY